MNGMSEVSYYGVRFKKNEKKKNLFIFHLEVCNF